MHLIKIGIERIHQRDVQAILPDAVGAILGHAMLVPRAIGGQHEVVGAQRHLVTIDIGERPAALHDEAQRRGRMAMAGGALARRHHLQPRIEPAHRRHDIGAPGVLQIDDAAARLLGGDQIQRAQHVLAQITIAPQVRHRGRDRLPWFDLVGHGPQRAGAQRFEPPVIGQQFRRIGDVGPAEGLFAVLIVGAGHGDLLRARRRRRPELL